VRLISNNDDYEDCDHRMNLWIERDFLSKAKRNGKAFPHVFRFTVTRRKKQSWIRRRRSRRGTHSRDFIRINRNIRGN